jgi:hypothetical protein
MNPQRQLWMLRLLIIGAFGFCGAAVYSLAYWLVWNNPVYQRVFWSPFRVVAHVAVNIVQIGLWMPLGMGLLLGISIVAVHARRWLLLPIALLLIGLGVMILVGFL